MRSIASTIKKISEIAVISLIGVTVFVPTTAVGAVDSKAEIKKGITAAGGTGSTADLPALIQNVINVLLFVAGAVAVIMILLGGIRYITSNGDQAHIKAAKDTILYSVIGLIVAILAYAIVNFIIDKL